MGGSAAGVMAATTLPAAAGEDELASVVRKASVNIAGRTVAPIYAVAYIDPGLKSQQGQEATVARYPIALVPQDDRPHFRRWRDDVRRLNPRIILLAYQMTMEETTVPGPGHDRLRLARDSWCTWPGGAPVWGGKPEKRRRLYDPRKAEWKERFLEACAVTLRSYPYDGLFLDQCGVFFLHSLPPHVRRQMRKHLGETLMELRRRQPGAVLIGNSSYDWEGLNGEMSEADESRFDNEFRSFAGHAQPQIDLGLVLLDETTGNDDYVRRRLISTCRHGALFSAAASYQHVPWFRVYDEVLKIAS